jgi:hypothetical protein
MSDLILYQGDNLKRQWTLYATAGTPYDLSNATATFDVSTILGAPVASYSTTDGTGYLTITSPLAGVVALSVPGSVTATWAVPANGVQMCRVALRITYSDGSVQTLDARNLKLVRRI